MWFKLALRLFRRELGRGELTIIAIAITLAVLSVFSLSAISSRIQGAILHKSSSFIAADRVLQSPNPIDEQLFDGAPLADLRQDRQILFSSVLFFNDEMQMGEIKAVTERYPLRGELKISLDYPLTQDPAKVQSQGHLVEIRHGGPALGEVWLAAKMFELLTLKIGDKVEVGATYFTVTGVVVEEPDSNFNPFNTQPRVLMNIADIAKTQVIQPGSRITYRALFAGEDDAIKGLTDWLKPKLLDNQFWYGIKDRQSPISNALARAEQFLLLSGLLGVILAAVAIAVAAQRYCQRHYDPVAIFKTLGASARQVRQIYLAHLSFLTVLSVVLGLVLGYVIQALIFGWIEHLLPQAPSSLGLKPFMIAIATGITCALMFSLYPLLQLFKIPPIRVLRRNAGEQQGYNWTYLLICSGTVYTLMLLYSGSWLLSSLLFVVAVAIILVLLLLSRLFIHAGRAVGMRPSNPFNLAMASIKRRVQANSVQLITFTFAIHLLLALFFLKNDIIGEWQAQLPQDAPNHFLANVTQTEMTQVTEFLQQQQIQSQGLYPIVRGTLVTIDDERLTTFVSKEDEEVSDGGGRQGIGRELNMTWTKTLPIGNEVVEGQWFSPDATGQVSVAQRIAARMDIDIGSKLTFLIGAEEYKVTVSSIRKIDWNTLQPNFFMIFTDDVLAQFPATYITAFHVDDEQLPQFNQFVRQFPTIMVIAVDNIIQQIQSVVSQVSIAIEFVLLIVVIAGVLVLIAQVQASMEERQQEIVILRTLGAKGSLIRGAVMLEFLMLGLIAGVMATIATEVLLALLQVQIFKIDPSIHWTLWWMGSVIGGGFVAVVGFLSSAQLLRRNTNDLLRALH